MAISPFTALWAVWGMVDSICISHSLDGNEKYLYRPVFALVEATCHRHVAFTWVRIHIPGKKKNTIRKDGVFFLVGDGGFEPPKA